MLNKKIASELAVGIVIIIALVIGAIFWMQRGDIAATNFQELSSNKKQGSEDMLKNEIPTGWKLFKHDVLGIEFVYPDSWGEPYADPIRNITKLSDMNKTFEQQNIYYRDSLDIVFSNNEKIKIKFFNENFTGKSERNISEPADYYADGSMENILNLKKSSNICFYDVNFKYKYNDEMDWQELKTLGSDCANENKLILTEDRLTFGKLDDLELFLYSYDLKLLAFKKMQNGYFDNVLISYNIDHLSQIDNKLQSLDNFLDINKKDGSKTISKEQLKQMRDEFNRFSNSISKFEPVKEQLLDFQYISGEDPNITIIRKYYWLISTGKVEDAYAMYQSTNISLDTFKQWYENVFFAKPTSFKEKAKGVYEFNVQFQEQNANPTEYEVVMDVSEGKLKTKSSREILAEPSVFGKMKALAVKRNENNYVLLKKEGREIIIQEAEAQYDEKYENIGKVIFFSNVKFSPNGNFVIYNFSGWEWGGSSVYNIAEDKVVFTQGMADDIKFSDDEKNAFTCAASAFDGTFDGLVFATYDFNKPIFDLEQYDSKLRENYGNIECNLSGNDVTFKLKDPWRDDYLPKEKVVTFSLSR